MPTHPSCPRCGYDQSGVVATWNTAPSCPLESTCPECGAAFRWGEILRDEETEARARQAEFVPSARAVLHTSRLALNPRRFWLGLRPDDPISPRRVLLIAFLGMLCVHAATGSAMWTIYAVRSIRWYWALNAGSTGVIFGFPWHDLRDAAIPAFAPVWTSTHSGLGPPWLSSRVACALVAFAFGPCAFRMLPPRFRSPDPDWPNLTRVWAYGFIALPLVVGIDSIVGFGLGTTLMSIGTLGATLNRWIGPAINAWYTHRGTIVTAAVLCWMFLWWRTALGRYLRAPAPALVALAVTLLSIFVVLLTVALIPHGPIWLAFSS